MAVNGQTKGKEVFSNFLKKKKLGSIQGLGLCLWFIQGKEHQKGYSSKSDMHLAIKGIIFMVPRIIKVIFFTALE